MCELISGNTGSKSKKSKSKQEMSVFSVFSDKFVCVILKQVAADYSLDYKELKMRYTGPKSMESYEPTREMEEFDLETETVKPVKPVKPKKVKAKEPKEKTTEKPKKTKEVEKTVSNGVPMALSKMKKQDLIDELDSLGIDSAGLTVVKLKEKVKEARESAGVVVAKGGRKAKSVKEVPVHTHEPLDEELVDDCRLCASHGNVMVGGTQLVADETEGDFVVANEDVLKARLAAILAEADDDEEDGDDEDDGNTTEGEAEGEELDMEDY